LRGLYYDARSIKHHTIGVCKVNVEVYPRTGHEGPEGGVDL